MRKRPRWSVRFTLGVAIAIALIVVVINFVIGGGSTRPRSQATLTAQDPATTAAPKPPARPQATPHRVIGKRRISVRIIVLHLVDPSRKMSISGQSVPRSFDTIVRYPIGLRGRFPLIVFGHGYAVTPGTYSRLLDVGQGRIHRGGAGLPARECERARRPERE
jgi:hypothetical protein